MKILRMNLAIRKKRYKDINSDTCYPRLYLLYSAQNDYKYHQKNLAQNIIKKNLANFMLTINSSIKRIQHFKLFLNINFLLYSSAQQPIECFLPNVLFVGMMRDIHQFPCICDDGAGAPQRGLLVADPPDGSP